MADRKLPTVSKAQPVATENSQQPTDALSSTAGVANVKSSRVKIAVRWVTAVLVATLFAYVTQTGEQSNPLSPKEQIVIGTWAFPVTTSGRPTVITFHADRTCEFLGQKDKYPTRWRIVDSSLVVQYKYQTMIGQLPIPMPAAVTNFELPSFMAHKETFTRSVSISEDGRTMTLGPLFAGQPHCDLIRISTHRILRTNERFESRQSYCCLSIPAKRPAEGHLFNLRKVGLWQNDGGQNDEEFRFRFL